MNGTAGASTAGKSPPESAIKLGASAKTIALLMPTKNKVITRTPLMIGPVIHCKWIKKGKNTAIPESATKLVNVVILTAVKDLIFFSNIDCTGKLLYC